MKKILCFLLIFTTVACAQIRIRKLLVDSTLTIDSIKVRSVRVDSSLTVARLTISGDLFVPGVVIGDTLQGSWTTTGNHQVDGVVIGDTLQGPWVTTGGHRVDGVVTAQKVQTLSVETGNLLADGIIVGDTLQGNFRTLGTHHFNYPIHVNAINTNEAPQWFTYLEWNPDSVAYRIGDLPPITRDAYVDIWSFGLRTRFGDGNVQFDHEIRPTKRTQGKKGADIQSASTIELGYDGNYFVVRRFLENTPIDYMKSAGWLPGSTVILHFADPLTVTNEAPNPPSDAAPFKLALGQNFLATPDDVLVLVWTGTVWLEISRSVN